MAKTPNGHRVEREFKIAIADECDRALRKLGAKPGLISRTESHDELYEILRRYGAESDLLKIVGSWRETMDDQWVLNELRRWNTKAH